MTRWAIPTSTRSSRTRCRKIPSPVPPPPSLPLPPLLPLTGRARPTDLSALSSPPLPRLGSGAPCCRGPSPAGLSPPPPARQESDASQCGGSDDGGGGTDEDAGCEDQSGDEGSERNERTDSPGGYGHQSQPQELAPQAEAEGRDSGTDEVWEEASATPITRRDSSKSEGDLDLANMATPQYSDGFCSDDGDDYSDDEFESIEDSDDFSSAGKRLTSPLRCQRGKEGDPRFGPLRRAFPCPRCVVRDERGRARAQKASEAGRAPQKPKPSFPQRLPLEQRVSALLRPIDRFLPGFASLPILCWPPTSAFARRETLPREPSRLDRQPPKERPE
mmetsp:Transcript_24982/g.59453  ORF Transcript_24982/g.59453 Transcript_24982/m.59453 type:complete len:332 (-) Transcript_24982:1086-2081(-)